MTPWHRSFFLVATQVAAETMNKTRPRRDHQVEWWNLDSHSTKDPSPNAIRTPQNVNNMNTTRVARQMNSSWFFFRCWTNISEQYTFVIPFLYLDGRFTVVCVVGTWTVKICSARPLQCTSQNHKKNTSEDLWEALSTLAKIPLFILHTVHYLGSLCDSQPQWSYINWAPCFTSTRGLS